MHKNNHFLRVHPDVAHEYSKILCIFLYSRIVFHVYELWGRGCEKESNMLIKEVLEHITDKPTLKKIVEVVWRDSTPDKAFALPTTNLD